MFLALACWQHLAEDDEDTGRNRCGPACEATDTGNDTDADFDTDAGTCDEHAPVIKEFLAEEGSILTTEDGSERYPSIEFRWEMTDEDADLNAFRYRLWIELADDGAADTGGPPLIDEEFEMKDGECTSDSAVFTVAHAVEGNKLDYETTYEATLIVTDMHGTDSEPANVTFVTPETF